MKQSGKKKEERRKYEKIKGYLITVKTNPEIEKIVEGELTKELQEELRIGGKFNPDDPNLPQKIKERIEETRELGYEIPYFYDSVTGKIFINENADSEEVRAKIAREWAIRNELTEYLDILKRLGIRDKYRLDSSMMKKEWHI